MRIIMLGDIVSRPGRQVLHESLRALRERFSADIVVANGENAAGGIGLTPPTLRELYDAGVDIVTSGNHIWRHKEIHSVLESDTRLLRPANMPNTCPGRGVHIHTLAHGHRVAVINLIGRTFMDTADCPFRTVESILAQLPSDISIRLVDFHAEATSEKRAMGMFLDGRVTMLAGTHTHVQTADAMILPEGTGYISDLGMCGAEKHSILGMDKEAVLQKFISGMPERFQASRAQGTINGILLEADTATGKARSLSLLRHTACPVLSL